LFTNQCNNYIVGLVRKHSHRCK